MVSLAHPSPTTELALMVDASAEHVGASLQQRTAAGGPWQPLGFFSKKLEPAQTRYSAFDCELWACFSGTWHFSHMLEGRRFILFTGHKPLTQALFRSSDPWTPRQCRQLSYIAEHTSDICQLAGLDNVVADMLSWLLASPAPSPAAACVKEPSRSQAAARQEGKSNPSPPSWAAAVATFDGRLDFLTIAAKQLTCPDTLSAIRSPVLSIQPVVIDGISVLCDTSRGLTRPLVPRADRQQVFAAIHGLAHPGTRATRRLMTSRVVWRGMTSDIARWVRECQHCSRGKVTSQPAAPVQPIQVPARRFSHIYVDLVGPLPVAADGSTYLLTIIDRSTRRLEAVPLRNMETATCVEALISTRVSRWHAFQHHHGQRPAVYISSLERHLPKAGSDTHHNNSISPAV
jgi:cleavage and polyadenylation specificity factor subunit 1